VSGVGAASVVLAHALAVSAVSHCHYVFNPPTRQQWFIAELALATALWLPLRWAVPRVWAVAREAPVTRLGGPLVAGLLVNLWWAGLLTDTLWLHKPAVRAALGPVLWVADWLTASAVYAGLLALTIDATAPDSDRARLRLAAKRLHVLVAFALFLVAANAFAVWYIGRERTLYFWDYMVYWVRCADLAEAMRAGPPGEVWDQVRRETQEADYGPLPAVPPSAVMAAFGDSRLAYVLAVVNLYLLALAAAAWLFVRRFAPSAGTLAVVMPLLLVLLSPVAWVPILRGYLDIGGAALGVLALLVYLSRPAGELPWPRVLLLAALLAGMAVFRRWYGFFVVAFFLTAGVDSALAMVRGGWRCGRPIVLTGAWAAVFLASVAGGWVARVAATDYGANFSAYKAALPLADRAWLVIDDCGPGTVAAALLGTLVLLAFRDTRRAALVIAAMPPIMLLHFLRMQDFAPHHCYLFLPAFVLLPGLALVRVLGAAPGWVRWPGVALVAAVGAAGMIVMFVPEARPYHQFLRPAVARVPCEPLTRADLPEFVQLLKATEDEAATTTGGRVAVVASSFTIGQTMFVTADLSLREPHFRRKRITITTEVDRVNGFPDEYFRADVLVVPTPPQTHLRAGEQQVVVLTTESLLNGTDIGRAFDRLPGEFRLADGVTVYLYRRARPIPPADFEAYCDKLRQAHPDVPAVFTPRPGTEDYLLLPLPREGR
jgi:hypothetical protein